MKKIPIKIIPALIFTMLAISVISAPAHGQSAAALDVVVRTQSGAAVAGVIVKLYEVDEARGELKDLQLSALTDSAGIAHFAVRPAIVAPRLLTGKSGIALVSEEAQGYSLPGLQFLTTGNAPLGIVILAGGVPVPDTAVANALPATPVVRSPKVGRPESRTWNEELAVRGLPTLPPAAAVASATAWAADSGLVDERNFSGTPISKATSSISPTTATPTNTMLLTATPAVAVQSATATSNGGDYGMWSCLILLALGFILSLIYSRRATRRVVTKGGVQ